MSNRKPIVIPVWRGRMGFLGPKDAVPYGTGLRWVVRCPAHGVWLAPPEPRAANQAWTNDVAHAMRFDTQEEAEAVAMMHASVGFETYAVALGATLDGQQEE